MNKRQRIWRGLKIFICVLAIIVLGPSVFNLPRAWIACQVWNTPEKTESTPGEADIREVTDKISDYARPEDQTYFTFPEWYIVYSTDEYGDFLKEHRAGEFPHFKAVAQYWNSYVDVCKVISGKYPFNGSEHFTLGFIGVSFTAENMIKGVYEGTIGRVTEWISSDTPTEEEIYAAQVADEYGEFLHMTPWYFFPFKEKLHGLWTETSLWGPDPIRKWERKFALTLEYGGKILYSSFTNLGAQATYGAPDVEKIYAVTEGVTDDMANDNFQIIENIDEKKQLVHITRFEYFSDTIPGLSGRGLMFIEIAGNDEILFTLIGPQAADHNFENGEYLFDMPILTQPGMTRMAVKVFVADINTFLQELKGRADIKFEHMYDY